MTRSASQSIRGAVFVAAAIISAAFNNQADASTKSVVAKVDISEQRMNVYVNGVRVHRFKVSTAGKGYRTPTGNWKPYRMHKMWYSRKYDNAPMPHSVFYNGGYAVHATGSIGRLGRPASHGCIRLHPANAKRFYNLVRAVGKNNTRIIVKR